MPAASPRYSIGAVVTNLKILEILDPGDGVWTTKYKVLPLCHENAEPIQLTHKAIAKRIQNKTKRCARCNSQSGLVLANRAKSQPKILSVAPYLPAWPTAFLDWSGQR